MIRLIQLVSFLICIQFFSSCDSNPSPQPKEIHHGILENISDLKQSAKKTGNKIYLDEALQLINKFDDDSLRLIQLSKLALAYQKLDFKVSFKSINGSVLALSEKLENKLIEGEAHWDYGVFYQKSHPDSAYFHYKQAYNLFSALDLPENKTDYPARMLLSMASTREQVKDYLGAEKEIVNAIELLKKHDNKKRLFHAYNLLAITQNGLNNFDKALAYHQKAKKAIRKKDAKSNLYTLRNINNIASTYLRKKDYPNAIKYYQKLVSQDSIEFSTPVLYAKGLNNLAYSKFMNNENDYNEIIKLFERSEVIFDQNKHQYYKARLHETYAKVLASLKDTLGAINEAQQAKLIAEKTSNNDRLLSALQLLTSLDKNNGGVYASNFFKLNNELQVRERNIRDYFARIELETDEILEQNELLAKQKQVWIGIAISLFLIIMAILTIISQRIKNQKLKFEQQQQESNEEIYNLLLEQQRKIEEGIKTEQQRISEELHDGILGEMLGIRLILGGLNDKQDFDSMSKRAALIYKLQEIEEEIRTLSHELSFNSSNEIHNFIISTSNLINEITSSAGMYSRFNHDEHFDWDSLKGEIKINCYRIIQVCLQNCVKHSKCERVVIDLKADKKMLILIIKDDGIGFDKSVEKKGIGLKNIESRVSKLNGTVLIESKKGEGTTVMVRIPIKKIRINLKKKKSRFKRKSNNNSIQIPQ